MDKHHIIVSHTTVETDPELTLEELCFACEITPEFIEELVEYGIIELNQSIEMHRFEPDHVRRIRTVVHLQRDLEINLPGAALAVDLMDEIEEMRTKIEILERHLFLNQK